MYIIHVSYQVISNLSVTYIVIFYWRQLKLEFGLQSCFLYNSEIKFSSICQPYLSDIGSTRMADRVPVHDTGRRNNPQRKDPAHLGTERLLWVTQLYDISELL